MSIGGAAAQQHRRPRCEAGARDRAGTRTPTSEVSALAVAGSTVYAGGDFSRIGGSDRNHIAALDATHRRRRRAGTRTPNAERVCARRLRLDRLRRRRLQPHRRQRAQLHRRPRCHQRRRHRLEPEREPRRRTRSPCSGSTVYAGGSFTSIGGQPRNYIAALDATSGAATAWNPNANQASCTRSPSPARTVYAGGNFTSIGGRAARHIAALDATPAEATRLEPEREPAASYAARRLRLAPSTPAATSRASAAQPRNRIAALDATSGAATDWNPNANGLVYALAVSGSTVYAGGSFTRIGGLSRTGIAALDATTGLAARHGHGAGNRPAAG